MGFVIVMNIITQQENYIVLVLLFNVGHYFIAASSSLLTYYPLTCRRDLDLVRVIRP